MLSELNSADKVAGAKQVKRALNDGRAKKLFLAADADPRVTEPLARLAKEKEVPVEEVSTMKELGAACSIAVGSAVAVLLCFDFNGIRFPYSVKIYYAPSGADFQKGGKPCLLLTNWYARDASR